MARLHILAHGYSDAGVVQRIRAQLGEAAGGQPVTLKKETVERSELGLKMLHLNLRGYISYIAETIALLRAMEEKPFLVYLNETFLTKAVENVELEGYQVLAR